MNFVQYLSQTPSSLPQAERRFFIKAMMAAGGALLVGCGKTKARESSSHVLNSIGDAKLEFNAFVKIAKNDQVTVIIKHLDKGQGVTTGLTTIVAEELDANWQQMHWEFAPADHTRYNNLFWGAAQGTAGSTSIANSWDQLRNAGAAAKHMLVSAAAEKWQVPASEILVESGIVKHGDKQYRFGQLVEAAAKMPVPQSPKLKSPEAFNIIGKIIPRKDSVAKTTGKAVFTNDFQMPGLLTALVLYPPKLFATLISFDAAEAKKMAGVVAVIPISRGVAVVAKSYWSAFKARATIKVEWDFSQCETRSSDELFTEFSRVANGEGTKVKVHGPVQEHFASADKIIEAEYRLPYLAHASMEPMNCVIECKTNACELWFGCQLPTNDQNDVAKIVGLDPGAIKIHTLFAGGSFGRRAAPRDYVVDAAEIAVQFKNKHPIKLIWTREDDFQNGKYRPMAVHKVRGALRAGKIVGWQHHVVAPPILRNTPFARLIKGPVDYTLVEGIENMPYQIPGFAFEATEMDVKISTLWWRSVGHSSNAFVLESFIDRLAYEAGRDAYQFRRELLQTEPRYLGVLDLAAQQSQWQTPLESLPNKKRGRGIAVYKAMRSWVAQVAEVTVEADGRFSVDKIVCAIDCGIAVNPDVVKAQMEGSIGFALGAALSEEITLVKGAVEQQNFGDYLPLRISQMPRVEVYIVPSAEAPSGVGEPGVPPVAPAVVNALRAARGIHIDVLPMGRRV